MSRPQFRLKTVFFATLVVAVISLAVARVVYLERQVDRALAAASRFAAHGVGYTVSAWPWPKAAIELDFSGSQSLDDQALKSLADLPIDEINLTGTPVSDNAVEAVRKARPNAPVTR
jgi:hypothetical protein